MTGKFKNCVRSLYHKIKNLMKFKRRIGLKNKDCSIIANNCGGGFITQHFGLKYYSPTEGLFFESGDYLKFVKNLTHYFEDCTLVFINPKDSIHYDYVKDQDKYGNYPVARLGDIEIFFMHYKSIEEAKEKWIRRSRRVNYDNLIAILFENETTTHEMLKEFDELPINHIEMVFHKYNDLQNAFYNENVAQHDRHHWKPQWVIETIDWKQEFNKIDNDCK